MIIGESGSSFTDAVVQAIHATRYIPNKIVVHIDPENPPRGLAKCNSVAKDIVEGIEADQANGKSIRENLRICRDFACGLPIYDMEEATKEILG